MSKMNLTYLVASPRALTSAAQAQTVAELKNFWLTHWQQTFDATGSPESGWDAHFDQQDVVVGLKSGTEVVSCHLYTFYDLADEKTLASDYFSYLQPSSIATLKERNVTRLMSMEYLGVSPRFSQNSERLSLGKLTVALATHVGESIRADAVFGTPITTTSTPKMMANVGAITLEEHIEKYGYDLCLQYVPTNPRLDCEDAKIAARAQELWLGRETLSRLNSFAPKKSAA